MWIAEFFQKLHFLLVNTKVQGFWSDLLEKLAR